MNHPLPHYEQEENRTFFRYLLLFLAAIQAVKLVVSFITTHQALTFYQFFFMGYFLFFYVLDRWFTFSTRFYHLFMMILLVLLTASLIRLENLGLSSFYLLLVALFAYILFEVRLARFYAAAVFCVKLGVVFFFSQTQDFYITLQIFFVSVMFLGAFDLLAISRSRAKNALHDLIGNLQKRVDEALSDAREQKQMLLQASKMATLGELLSAISHQWKQPLANISAIQVNMRMNEELLEHPNPHQLQLLQMLEEQVFFMNQTMHDFRNYFHETAPNSPFDVGEAIEQILRLLSASFKEHNIFVEVQTSKQPLQGYGNAPMFKQALLNIMVNSKDAITENNPVNRMITVEQSYHDRYITVTIQDHAGGMSEEAMHHLFTKHYTTKGEKGTGLGLAMTKEIIENFCHGKISVENSEDGLKTTLFVPLDWVR